MRFFVQFLSPSSLKGCLSHSVTVRSSTRSCPRRVTHICSTAHPRPRPRVRNKDFRYLQYSYVEKIEKLENALLVLLQPVMLAIPGLPTIVCQCEMHGTLHPETGVSRAGISGGGGDWGRPNNTGAPPRQRGLRLWPSHSPTSAGRGTQAAPWS